MRTITRIAATMGAAALASSILAAPASASDGSSLAGSLAGQNRGPNSVTTVLGNVDPAPWAFSRGGSPSNWYDFDILVNAVGANGGGILAEATEDGVNSALTLFAPNDRAFQLLAWDLSGRTSWPATEKQTVDAIVAAVQGGVDLNNLLAYHVTPGKLSGAQVLANGTLTMLNGGQVVASSNAFGSIRLDASGPLADPSVVRTVDAGDDIVHVISRVLVP